MSLVTTILIVALLGCDGSVDYPDYEAMIALRSSNGFSRALQAAERRIAKDPEDAVAIAVSALVFGNAVDFLAMDPAEARLKGEAALDRALKLAPSSPFTRAAFGLARRNDDPIAAELQLRQCIEEAPTFIECHNNLYGDYLRKAERPREAERVYLEAIDRWPDDGELRVSHALLLQETDRIEDAEAVLRKLVDERADFPRGRWHLATFLFETNGDLDEARIEARIALELDPLIWNGQRFLRSLERRTESL